MPRCSVVVGFRPTRQEQSKGGGRDGLGFLPQCGDGFAPDASQDLGVAPFGAATPGRNSPLTTCPSALRRVKAISTTDTPRPKCAAASLAKNGPWVRAYRPTNRRAGLQRVLEMHQESWRERSAECVAQAPGIFDRCVS